MTQRFRLTFAEGKSIIYILHISILYSLVLAKKIELIIFYWKALTQGSEETVCGKIKNCSN